MKDFIEITEVESGLKVLLGIGKITAILTDKNGIVFIETGVDGKGNSTGVVVRESYDEIKCKLTEIK